MHRGPPDNKLPTGSGSPSSEGRKRSRDSSLEDSKFSPGEDLRQARRPRIEDTAHNNSESSSDEDPPGREQLRAEPQGISAASARRPILDPNAAANSGLTYPPHAGAGVLPHQGGANAGAYQALLARQLGSMGSFQPGFDPRGGASAAAYGIPPSLGLSSSLLLLERQREEREQLLQEMAATRAAERLLASRSGTGQSSSHAPGGARLGGASLGGASLLGGLPPYATTSGFPLSSAMGLGALSAMGLGVPSAMGLGAPSAMGLGGPSNAALLSDLLSRSAARGFLPADAAFLARGGNPLAVAAAAARPRETTVELSLDWRTRRFLGLPPVPDEVQLGFEPGHPSLRGQMTGHPPEDLYMECDDDVLSDHQILLRKQIEFFEACPTDLHSMGTGRRRDITVGQVGIRCKHCAHLPAHKRPRGSMYFPASLRALYQAAQNMGVAHFASACAMIDEQVRYKLIEYQSVKNKAGHAGKKWWADGAKARGVIETETDGLRFVSPVAAAAPTAQQGEAV